MFIVVMGVSGSGKSTIGEMLAARLGWRFYDADDFHPPANIAKMASGTPLTDEDRAGWLAKLARLIRDRSAVGEHGVIACSALKRAYRDVLRLYDRRIVRFVYLRGAYETILGRMEKRDQHFMKAEMLKSQFDLLEEPCGILTIDILLPRETIVQKIVEQIIDVKYSLGILGLGIMGRGLAQNLVRNGYAPIGYDPDPRLPDEFDVTVATSLKELVGALTPPRTILVIAQAGADLPDAIAALRPLLQRGDLIIDGGNSYFADTERRVRELERDGLYFIGMGVSGGEIGAIWGPSLMPGGSVEVWQRVAPMFRQIAAVAEDGAPCVTWIGPGGAGHFVKMVHDGITCGDVQLIGEICDLLHRGAGISYQELADVFDRWNKVGLSSYLIEITAYILRRADEMTGEPLVDLILDEVAPHERTGQWTSQIALDIGSPVPTINAAVEGRLISGLKPERVMAAAAIGGTRQYDADRRHLIGVAERALYAARITAYAQGLGLLRSASTEFGWDLALGRIIRGWRAGCALQGAALDDIAAAFDRDPNLPNLLMDKAIQAILLDAQSAWREALKTAIDLGIPMPATSASLAYYEAYRSEILPANLTQTQRDHFEAHTYPCVDREGSFHTEW